MIRPVRSAKLILVTVVAGCGGIPHPKPHQLPVGVSFAGTWESTWGKMVLRQEGKHVSGSFTGYREGGLTGTLDGDVWNFVWDQRVPRQHGRGFMQISADGQHLEGRWGYEKDDDDGGRWAGDRGND
jgi:hypothetical protein